MSLTTAVSEDDEAESVHTSPYKVTMITKCIWEEKDYSPKTWLKRLVMAIEQMSSFEFLFSTCVRDESDVGYLNQPNKTRLKMHDDNDVDV